MARAASICANLTVHCRPIELRWVGNETVAYSEKPEITKRRSVIGEKLRQYRVDAEIGAGAMGVVYRAFDTVLERSVAIKILSERPDRDLDGARLVDEARNVSALNHPNICTIHDVAEDRNCTFIVMELIEGRSLTHLLIPDGLNVESIMNFGHQIAGALSHAHERGIIHRDLKGDNVVVTADLRVKVLDFGLAMRLRTDVAPSTTASDPTVDRTDSGHAVAGTLSYMAPEILRGGTADFRTDVWSLGILLYEMTTGHVPFKGSTIYELSAAILREPVPAFPERVPFTLAAVIKRCLAKYPGARYQSAREVQVALETLRSGFEVRAAGAPDRPDKADRGDKNASHVRVLVLPFADRSPDADQGHLADGLTEEIITDLSNIDRLRVISRTSSLRLKDSSDDIARIGEQLNVQYVVEGSVRKAGKKLRVNVNVVDVSTDSPVWGCKFGGAVEEVFDIQDQVSKSIVDALALRVTSVEQHRMTEHPISDVRVYECYLKAKQEMLRFSSDALDRALGHLRAGAAIDENNLLLLSASGEVHWQYVNAGLSIDEGHLDKARTIAKKILSLDENSAAAHRLSGLIRYHDGDTEGGLRELRQALKLEPNDPDTLMWLSLFTAVSGQPKLAVPWMKRLLEIDPLTPLYQVLPGVLAQMDGNFDEASQLLQKGYTKNLENPGVRLVYGQSLAMCGRNEDGFAVFDALVYDMPESPFAHVGDFYRRALRGERGAAAEAVSEETKKVLRTDLQYSWMLSQCYALIGDNNEGMSWLTNAVERGFVNFPLLANTDPLLTGMRGEPEFAVLMTSVEQRWKALEF